MHELTRLIQEDMRPALGVTEPGAIAFAASTAKRHAPGAIRHILLRLRHCRRDRHGLRSGTPSGRFYRGDGPCCQQPDRKHYRDDLRRRKPGTMKGVVAVDAAWNAVDMVMENVYIHNIHGINADTPRRLAIWAGSPPPGITAAEKTIVDILAEKRPAKGE